MTDYKKLYEREKQNNSDLEDLIAIQRSEIEALLEELELASMVSREWMEDYDALKEKYEPTVLVTGDEK